MARRIEHVLKWKNMKGKSNCEPISSWI
ncbi:uncharacterized protein G2W53_033803 [Senna tora]|uniref:Uncharacterized protein n=1 Tax=Senna tora TaxID=362788 RepID=A0A834W8C8_9FABA|nr:uncharacterized protein G2W53_033803 [Senna tora]